MTPFPRPSATSGRRALFGLTFLSVGLGAAAALLAVPSSAGAGKAATPSFASALFPSWAVLLGAEVVFPIFLGAFILFLYARVRSGEQSFAGGLALMGFSVIAIGVLFVWLFQVIHYPGYQWFQGAQGSPPSNQTIVPPVGQSVPPGNQTGNPIPGSSGGPSWWASLVDWLPIVGGIVAALVVALLVLPKLAPPQAPETEESTEAPAKRALEEAIDSLDREGSDPRLAIRAAYARLLLRAQNRLPPLDPATPREIEELLVHRLRVAPSVAGELTALFEEARYSTHPLGPETVERARRLLGQALAEMEPRARSGPSE
ncbi:MAG: DUF4129 domain-containing protein [Thermoplasmata archaeon]|nr:DUF4129 domain-containing protein [Thermoplasmata archaeon]